MLIWILICFFTLIFVLSLHYYQHFRLDIGCSVRNGSFYGSRTLPTSTPETMSSGPTPSDHTLAARQLIHKPFSGGRGRKCRFKLSSVDGEDFDFFPMSFLFYVIYLLSLCILILILNIYNFYQIEHDEANVLLFGYSSKSYHVNSVDDIHSVSLLHGMDYFLIYCIMILSVWEGLFSFYRYYTTVVATVHCSDTSTQAVIKRFSIYAVIFCTLFILQIHVYYYLWPIIVLLSFTFNSYCTYKFASLLIDRYTAFIEMDEDFQTATNKEILSSVKFMRLTSMITCGLQSIYLMVFMITYNVVTIYYLPIIWTPSCFIFTINFVRNRQALNRTFLKLKQKYAQFVFKCCKFDKMSSTNCCKWPSSKIEDDPNSDNLPKNKPRKELLQTVVSNSFGEHERNRKALKKKQKEEEENFDPYDPKNDPFSPENDIYHPSHWQTDEEEEEQDKVQFAANDNGIGLGHGNTANLMASQSSPTMMTYSLSDNLHNKSQRRPKRGHHQTNTAQIHLSKVSESQQHEPQQLPSWGYGVKSDPVTPGYTRMELSPKSKAKMDKKAQSNSLKAGTPNFKKKQVSFEPSTEFKYPRMDMDGKSNSKSMSRRHVQQMMYSPNGHSSHSRSNTLSSAGPRKNKALELLGLSAATSPQSLSKSKSKSISPRKQRKGSPRKGSPRKLGKGSPRKISPRKQSKNSPRKISPRKISPRKISPRKASKGSPRIPLSAPPPPQAMGKDTSITVTWTRIVKNHPSAESKQYVEMMEDKLQEIEIEVENIATDDDGDYIEPPSPTGSSQHPTVMNLPSDLPYFASQHSTKSEIKSVENHSNANSNVNFQDIVINLGAQNEAVLGQIEEFDVYHDEKEESPDPEEMARNKLKLKNTGSHCKSISLDLDKQKKEQLNRALDETAMGRSLKMLGKFGFASRKSINSIKELQKYQILMAKEWEQKEQGLNGRKNTTVAFGKNTRWLTT